MMIIIYFILKQNIFLKIKVQNINIMKIRFVMIMLNQIDNTNNMEKKNIFTINNFRKKEYKIFTTTINFTLFQIFKKKKKTKN